MHSSVKKKMGRPTVNEPASSSKTSPLVKASARRLEASFRQLEALHKSSGTSSHLRIPDRKRIKLLHDHPSDSVYPASRTKKGSKSGVSPSVLKEDDSVTRGTRLIELSDSDEFPEPRELVRASIRSAGEADESLVSRAADYSDPDMDAVIRGAHLDDITSTGIGTANNQDISGSGSIQRTQERKEKGYAVSVTAQTRATARIVTTSPRHGLRPQVRTHTSHRSCN
jgi:hypothetical protein